MQFDELLDILDYSESQNYLPMASAQSSLQPHIFRAAKNVAVEGGVVEGVYTFHTSPDDEILPVRPAVYLATAQTPDAARKIHRKLWNLGNAPFLIILLPNQIRVYTGFNYDERDETRGLLLDTLDRFLSIDLSQALADYKADSIDSGLLWKNRSRDLKPENRVDVRLLRSLKNLEEALTTNLDLETAHSLIGKYVYIRYLRDRKILSPQWLEENHINIDYVLGRNASLKELRKLVEALDERFNGRIFPFAMSGKQAPTDEQVSLVASAFKGDDPISRQLHFDFEPYDFSYIPVETLSAIYEQFLHSQGKGKEEGAVYTPEPLADYLIAEMNHTKPLEKGMKILDPCCGSGIFLVLAYRKLIELELAQRPDGKLKPTELREILTESIYGVERTAEACFVAELSLILTMLNYIEPPELHRNKQFKFPELHNTQIFESDFFNDSSDFWKQDRRYDWIIGNPPWTKLDTKSESAQLTLKWIQKNRKERPVADNRPSEAFSWRVIDAANQDGQIGLVLHANSLFNHKSKKYRQSFFKQHEVARVTNFSNLAYVLFGKRGEAPAATIIYRVAKLYQEKASIDHYGPFIINQLSNKPWKERTKQATWSLAINENEIQIVRPEEAESGDVITWKLALWGNYRDKRALKRLSRLFPTCLENLSQEKDWHLYQGVALGEEPTSAESEKYLVEYAPELEGKKFFDANLMKASNFNFSVPISALQDISSEKCFLRKRSGKEGLKVSKAPHLILNAAYFAYSNQDFIVLAPHIGLSVPKKDTLHLRALSVFLNSSVSNYCLFFQSPTWGIDRTKVYAEELRKNPVPIFTEEQITELAALHKDLAAQEVEDSGFNESIQKILDDEVERILKISKNLGILAREFMQVRLSLNKGKVTGIANSPAKEKDLRDYGETLRNELDTFTKGKLKHKVSLIYSPAENFVFCTIEFIDSQNPKKAIVERADSHTDLRVKQIQEKVKQQFSQWIYVQRGLRIFEGSKFHICKSLRLLDWTRTQALNDSDDIIAEMLSDKATAAVQS